jgi:hypothetical protein
MHIEQRTGRAAAGGVSTAKTAFFAVRSSRFKRSECAVLSDTWC